MNIELPDNMDNLEAERNVQTDKMKNVGRLLTDIDSIRDHNQRLVGAFSKTISARVGAFPVRDRDTTNTAKDSVASIASDTAIVVSDTLRDQLTTQTTQIEDPSPAIDSSSIENSNDIAVHLETPRITKSTGRQKRELQGPNLLDAFKTFEKGQILDNARNGVRNILNTVKGKGDELDLSYKRYNVHILSLHRKFALALSCIILFFVGAPLGAIIRKGGLGLPMVVAIVLFLAYYFFGVFSGNYAKEGNIHPILGAWLPTLIMLPLGVWLTRRATADRGLMSFGHFTDWFRKRFRKKKKAGDRAVQKV